MITTSKIKTIIYPLNVIRLLAKIPLKLFQFIDTDGDGTSTYSYMPSGNMEPLSNKTFGINYSFYDLPFQMNTPNGKIVNYYTSSGIKLKSAFYPEEQSHTGPVINNYFAS